MLFTETGRNHSKPKLLQKPLKKKFEINTINIYCHQAFLSIHFIEYLYAKTISTNSLQTPIFLC